MPSHLWTKAIGAALGVTAAAAAVWAALVHPWHVRWGATDGEVEREMPGDDLVAAPCHVTTRAITVRARPGEIWAWLAQMGKGRGGLYSIDWLDELFGILDAPSAEQVLPEWQRLAAGDVIPVGRMAGWPVHAAEPGRSLVLRIEDRGVLVTQSWGLYPADAERTRLVLRVRAAMPPGLRRAIGLAALDPQEFIMVRAQLRGIRRRAEALARARRATEGAGAGPAASPGAGA